MDTTRRELYEQLDKPALQSLPSSRYQYATWKLAKINIDYHFTLDEHYYSVPYQYIGKKVEIRATNKSVECFYDNQRITVHVRNYKKYAHTTIAEHMPKGQRVQLRLGVSAGENKTCPGKKSQPGNLDSSK